MIGVICVGAAVVRDVLSHGPLLDPPSPSNLCRFIKKDSVIAPYADEIVRNRRDHQLFCGSFQVGCTCCRNIKASIRATSTQSNLIFNNVCLITRMFMR